jgi:hypothetical protein
MYLMEYIYRLAEYFPEGGHSVFEPLEAQVDTASIVVVRGDVEA